MPRFFLLAIFLSGGLGAVTPASGRQPTRHGPCATDAKPGETWTSFPFLGLRLAVSLPADLRPVPFASLGRVVRRARARSIPMLPDESVQLVAAWEAPSKSTSEVRRVLLYSVRPDSVPPGRPCALPIAGQPGFIFRTALSAEGRAADEYWVEAYWPGFVLVAAGRSLDAYEVVFGILRTITVTPSVAPRTPSRR